MNNKYHPKSISEIIILKVVAVTIKLLFYIKFSFVIAENLLGGPGLLQTLPYYLTLVPSHGHGSAQYKLTQHRV